MAFLIYRQMQGPLLAAASMWVAIPESIAAITARDLTFDGNPLWLIGIGVIVVSALLLTCFGALRSDRGDRGFSSARRAGHGGPVYGDIDDEDHPHIH